ncbi:hypothetical protein FRC12_016842 [Ceratobasidium sp. 428]|nr:hypothetical protein FRC12_016842 [Ceratobasidium sp. 428]
MSSTAGDFIKDWLASLALTSSDSAACMVAAASKNSHGGDKLEVAACSSEAEEAEVENLIQVVEVTEVSDSEKSTEDSLEEGEIQSTTDSGSPNNFHSDLALREVRYPSNKADVSKAHTSNTFPTSRVRSSASGSKRHSAFIGRYRPYGRIVRPGDWEGGRYGNVSFHLLPVRLARLLLVGNQWSFSRTAPTSSCRSRIIGDIHFTPGEVEGYSYWVCCEIKESEFGRGWLPWNLADKHPQYSELVLEHFASTVRTPPAWRGPPMVEFL